MLRPSVAIHEYAVAIDVIGDAVLAQRQPVGCGIDRDNRLGMVRFQILHEAGARQGGANLH